MVEVASIVIAVISLLGTLLATSIGAWVTFYSDERKRRSETEKLVTKYRDPLLLAAHDFQSRLLNITDQHLLSWHRGPPEHKNNLERYTCFLVGQYWSWNHILARQTQFFRFETHKANTEFIHLLDQIQGAFSMHSEKEPFVLFRGQQLALGEIMTIKEDDEYYCMGYSAFDRKWTEDEVFRGWFKPLVDGIHEMGDAHCSDRPIPDRRLRRLQHLLLQLIRQLDPKGQRVDASRHVPCRAAEDCVCSTCGAVLGGNEKKGEV